MDLQNRPESGVDRGKRNGRGARHENWRREKQGGIARDTQRAPPAGAKAGCEGAKAKAAGPKAGRVATTGGRRQTSGEERERTVQPVSDSPSSARFAWKLIVDGPATKTNDERGQLATALIAPCACSPPKTEFVFLFGPEIEECTVRRVRKGGCTVRARKEVDCTVHRKGLWI
ncbi:unnamed protein product [Bursaphelenchus xylophilus]|uniref:(pine wood nematode) hypothetical protein n=1 Tax=Bursaphelenchus xylophilus TaxID=6326 RepID=A0A1I7RXC2_BURXY|nr:unnamed protein product [Bursaphelenchus xylophilus]CAG9121553.1 unnamed protein product [Bursaphelenchus xylophilus]